MNYLFRFFNKRWLLATLLVIAASSVMVRLGIWQLDRLEQRRAFNTRVLVQVNQDPFVLTEETVGADLTDMEYRKVVVTGEYDSTDEVVLRNQSWQNQYGVHLITPLKINGTETVILVDRGWIPGDEFNAGMETGNWQKYAETGIITIEGVIRRSQDRADFGRIADPTPFPGESKMLAWNYVNIEQIQKQATSSLLPVYIQQSPDPEWTKLPYRSEPDLELTEGPHLGYAIQWFTFAAILFFGYPLYVHKEDHRFQKASISSAVMSENPIGD